MNSTHCIVLDAESNIVYDLGWFFLPQITAEDAVSAALGSRPLQEWADVVCTRAHWDLTSFGETASSERYWKKLMRTTQLYKMALFGPLEVGLFPILRTIKEYILPPLDVGDIVGECFGTKKKDAALWRAVLPDGLSMSSIKEDREKFADTEASHSV